MSPLPRPVSKIRLICFRLDPPSTGDSVAFNAVTYPEMGATQQGMYRVANGATTTIADLNTPIPSGTGNFTELWNPNGKPSADTGPSGIHRRRNERTDGCVRRARRQPSARRRHEHSRTRRRCELRGLRRGRSGRRSGGLCWLSRKWRRGCLSARFPGGKSPYCCRREYTIAGRYGKLLRHWPRSIRRLGSG